ncbi:MAG TPA: hypothetical protein DCY93_03280 [Firmicutes bacterium]|nr:hypothetical protein [Bacillota bacterium]
MKQDKINKEMNKFLSYLYMGENTFRIYLRNVQEDDLMDLLTTHINKFKEHEQNIEEKISNYCAVKKNLSFMQKRVLCMERMKADGRSDMKLAFLAVKAINMGLESAMKFLYEYYSYLPKDFADNALIIVAYYGEVNSDLKAYILKKIKKD